MHWECSHSLASQCVGSSLYSVFYHKHQPVCPLQKQFVFVWGLPYCPWQMCVCVCECDPNSFFHRYGSLLSACAELDVSAEEACEELWALTPSPPLLLLAVFITHHYHNTRRESVCVCVCGHVCVCVFQTTPDKWAIQSPGCAASLSLSPCAFSLSSVTFRRSQLPGRWCPSCPLRSPDRWWSFCSVFR